MSLCTKRKPIGVLVERGVRASGILLQLEQLRQQHVALGEQRIVLLAGGHVLGVERVASADERVLGRKTCENFSNGTQQLLDLVAGGRRAVRREQCLQRVGHRRGYLTASVSMAMLEQPFNRVVPPPHRAPPRARP